MFLEPVLKKIRQIQRSDDKSKKRWVFFLSGVSALLVLVLWIIYLNISLPSLKPSEEISETAEIKEVEQPSFLGVLGKGFTIIGANFQNQIKNSLSKTGDFFNFFADQIKKGNEFEIDAR